MYSEGFDDLSFKHNNNPIDTKSAMQEFMEKLVKDGLERDGFAVLNYYTGTPQVQNTDIHLATKDPLFAHRVNTLTDFLKLDVDIQSYLFEMHGVTSLDELSKKQDSVYIGLATDLNESKRLDVEGIKNALRDGSVE